MYTVNGTFRRRSASSEIYPYPLTHRNIKTPRTLYRSTQGTNKSN